MDQEPLILHSTLERLGVQFSPSKLAAKAPAAAAAHKFNRMVQRCEHRDASYPEYLSGNGSYAYHLNSLRLVRDKLICRGDARRLTEFEKVQLKDAEHSYQWLKATHGKNFEKDEFEEVILALMAERFSRGRKADMSARLELELINAIHNDYGVVFDTLTVEDGYYNLVFRDKPNSVWTEYVKKFKRKTSYEAVYFAVVEHGSKTGRPHIHVIWFIPNPPQFKDPAIKTKRDGSSFREIDELKFSVGRGRRRGNNPKVFKGDPKMWEYGWQTPILVRWPGDVWSKRGFKWPLVRDKKTSKVTQLDSIPQKITGYLLKYITKDVLQPDEERKKVWRIRKTQRLGIRHLMPILRKQSSETLVALIRLPKIPATVAFRAMLRNCASVSLIEQLLDNCEPTVSEIITLPCQESLLIRLRKMRSEGATPEKTVRDILDAQSTGVFNPQCLQSTAEYNALEIVRSLNSWKEKAYEYKAPGFGYTAQ